VRTRERKIAIMGTVRGVVIAQVSISFRDLCVHSQWWVIDLAVYPASKTSHRGSR
jgi:hypothetical protein